MYLHYVFKGEKIVIGTSQLFNCTQSHTAACLHKIVLARRIQFLQVFPYN
jgi:hypothetical protein